MYELFSETTFHGLTHIQKDKPRVLQLFWFIAFLAAASAASVLFYHQIERYRSKPMAAEYRLISNKTMQLPGLTICTKYPLNLTKMMNLNISETLGYVLNTAYSVTENPTAEVLNAKLEEYENLKIKLHASSFVQVWINTFLVEFSLAACHRKMAVSILDFSFEKKAKGL